MDIKKFCNFDLQEFALGAIKKNENFFVEGSGTAVITGDHGNLALMHLQDMNIEMSSEMEDIFGGESNLPVYSYQTEKNTKVTFTNASMNLDVISVTQGVTQEEQATVFKSEKFEVPTGGEITLSETTADLNTLVLTDDSGSLVAFTKGTGVTLSVDSAYDGKTLEAFYDYTVTAGAIGTSVLTTSVPGYVTISHRSKPMKQKNGRVIRIYTKIYRARCDGTLNVDFKHKEAFAPELTFNMVDPERADKKYISFTIRDVTDDPDLENMISPM